MLTITETQLDQTKKIKRMLSTQNKNATSLMPCLYYAQTEFGYINEKMIEVISDGLELPIATVYGVVSYYPSFKITTRNSFELNRAPINNNHKGRVADLVQKIRAINTNSSKKITLHFNPNQEQRILRNCGVINPRCIEDSLAAAGYEGIKNALTYYSPQQIISILIKSNLKGRGGGGFLTGEKWQLGYNHASTRKYIICNANEGDPLAFSDRLLIEQDPHKVLEGMMISGYAVGASTGYIYINSHYDRAINCLKKAIQDAHKKGLLGKQILNNHFSFDIKIKYGGNAFNCGEETALLNSLEGKRGEPRNKPPYPTTAGLYNEPTIINNVETLANVSLIINNSINQSLQYEWKDLKGTKVITLSGNVNNSGIVELPMGTTLHELVYTIGGGISSNKKLKALHIGGPTGGVIPSHLIDTSIDFESFQALGLRLGSASVLVLDESHCMVDLAMYCLDYSRNASCGKCTPCRIGTVRLHEILVQITKGRATESDLLHLKTLAQTISETSLCGLGQTAAYPIISNLNYFYEEFLTHIEHHVCPAGVCKLD